MALDTVVTTDSPYGPAADAPSASQRAAIEAEPGSLLVLAGQGAGKTYCLTERIRFLIERQRNFILRLGPLNPFIYP